MKKPLCLVLVASIAIVPGIASANHKLQGSAIRDIQANAQALERDAAIYQRKRTGMEIGRIAADVRNLQKALATHDCLKAEARELQTATASLRAAQFSGDPARAAVSAQRLIALANGLLQKDCGT